MIPRPPIDASILGLFQAYRLHEGQGLPEAAATHSFFGKITSPFTLLPKCVEHISKQAFRGLLTPTEITENHTLSSVLGICVKQENWSSYLDALAAGQTTAKSPANYRRYVPSKAMRSCPKCVSEDLNTYGFAYWRASHQWRPIKTCLFHQTRLEQGCRICGCKASHPTGVNHRPDTPCSQCGSLKKHQVSLTSNMVYDAYAKAFFKARWTTFPKRSHSLPAPSRHLTSAPNGTERLPSESLRHSAADWQRYRQFRVGMDFGEDHFFSMQELAEIDSGIFKTNNQSKRIAANAYELCLPAFENGAFNERTMIYYRQDDF